MILQDNDTTIEQIGTISDEAQFKMKASRKAFQILSDLYSDKPLAIVRELGCNAADSMTASGKGNLPFHIHLPNSLEPWLTIQDFGTGISHENIYNIYTTYFESTKTNSNSQIGCLGLGSKSPFCYTDNFTITSIVNGEKRIYNAYFNASNMPTIALMSMEKTTDANGVAIQIPIKTNDFDLFHYAVLKAFRFFDIHPTISGGKIDWEQNKPEFVGNFWKSYSGLNQSYAVMGGVTYPIDTYKVSAEHYEIVRKAGLVISFNIGEIDFTPSRESLSYCEQTIKALNDKIDMVKNDFVQKVEDTIKSSPNLLDAMKALYLLQNQWSFLNSKLVSGKVFWNKIEITDPRRSIAPYAPSLKCYSKKVWGRGKYSESGYPNLDNNSEWYVDDLAKGGLKRVIQEIRHSQNSNISINIITLKEQQDLITAGFPKEMFKYTSSLAPVSVKRASGGGQSKPKGIINVYDLGYGYRSSWESKSFDLSVDTAPTYYIEKPVKGWDFDPIKVKDVNGKNLFFFNSKSTLKDVCENHFGIKMTDVKMVAQSNTKHLVALGSKSLKEYIESKMIDVDMDAVEEAEMHSHNAIQSTFKHPQFKNLSENNPFRLYIEDVHAKIQKVKNVSAISKYFATDDKKKLTFPSKLIELFYTSLDSWQVGVERVLNAALEMETNK
jgi:hypothetical protein